MFVYIEVLFFLFRSRNQAFTERFSLICLLLVQEVNLLLYKHVLPYKFGLYRLHTNPFSLF